MMPIELIERISFDDAPEDVFAAVLNTTAWREESIVLFGKKVMQPRLVAWYGDPEACYTYSGVAHHPLEWTPVLENIRRTVERLTRRSFNSVLCNLYRNGADSMGFHSDDEKELGPDPFIASVSLGAERTIRFVPKVKGTAEPLSLKLPDRSLLMMYGDSQRRWKHGIPKTKRLVGPRINLTFRQVYQSA